MNGSHQRHTPEGGEHVPSGAAGGVVSTWARGEDGARGHDAAPTQPQAWDWNRAGYDRPGHPQDQSPGPQHGQRDPWATPGGPTPPGGGGDDHGRGGGGGRE